MLVCVLNVHPGILYAVLLYRYMQRGYVSFEYPVYGICGSVRFAFSKLFIVFIENFAIKIELCISCKNLICKPHIYI